MDRGHYLDKAIGVSRLAEEISDGEDVALPFTGIPHFGESDDELCGGPFLLLYVFDIDEFWIGDDAGERLPVLKQVEEVAQGGTEGESVPELSDWVRGVGLTTASRGEGQCEEESEAGEPGEPGSELGTLLVEGGGGGGGLVELVGGLRDVSVDGGHADHRFFAVGDGGRH